uniref:Cyclin N-terminal domain-containing protein n=1 Tax=Panagrolaimus sp. PS1159 TaxID=55785 RepID=A0AC35FQI5_9BILA
MSDPDETNSSVSGDRHSRSTVPEFHDEIYAVPDELTDEILSELIIDNTQYVENLPYGMGSYLSTDIIQYMFTICIRLRLPDDVKYLAMDIFDRYMNIQGQVMYDSIAALNRSNSTKFKIWEKIEASLSRQLSLRICTAIQIASKMHSFHHSLAKHNVKIMLQALGFPYTENAIEKSELRMLKTLNFEMNSRRSPAVYMINFLKILKLRMLKTLNFKMNSHRSPAEYMINFLKILSE